MKEVVEKNEIVPMLADWTDAQRDRSRHKLAGAEQQASIPLLAIYPAGKPGEVIVLRDVISETQLLAALQKAGPSKSVATTQAGESVPTGAIAAGN